MTRERTMTGLKALRAEGCSGARPRILNSMTRKTISLIDEHQAKVGDLAMLFNLYRRTLGRNIQRCKYENGLM